MVPSFVDTKVYLQGASNLKPEARQQPWMMCLQDRMLACLCVLDDIHFIASITAVICDSCLIASKGAHKQQTSPIQWAASDKGLWQPQFRLPKYARIRQKL
ncbi:hypothetical protein ABBQ32_009279 [Trebouxia sp. C0010 RCD-2024]